MAGNLSDFKPHHRLSAAKELLRRGFDTPTPSDAGSSAAQEPAVGPPPAEKTKEAPNAWIRARLGRYADYPVGYKRYEIEYGPFDFRSYDDEDYHFDTHGSEALRHISGSEEAASAVRETLWDFRLAAWRLAEATGQDPKDRDRLIKFPDDCPQPENIYGYQALLRIFSSEQAARIAAWAAAQYHREQAALAGDYPALRPRPNDGPALPISSRNLYTSPDPSAEEEYPEDRSPAELGRDPPDSTEKPWWVELIKEGRRARAYGDTTPGYSWGTIHISQSTTKATVFVGGGIVSIVDYQEPSCWREVELLRSQTPTFGG